jgi:hypothetical protein
MPINRPDGRHWCAPDREEPDESGQWTCPDCGQVWLRSVDSGSVLWEPPEVREQRLAAQATAERPPTSEEPLSGSEEGTSGG